MPGSAHNFRLKLHNIYVYDSDHSTVHCINANYDTQIVTLFHASTQIYLTKLLSLVIRYQING